MTFGINKLAVNLSLAVEATPSSDNCTFCTGGEKRRRRGFSDAVCPPEMLCSQDLGHRETT